MKVIDVLIDKVASGNTPVAFIVENALKEDTSSTWNKLKDSERYAKLFMLFPRTSIKVLGILSQKPLEKLPLDIKKAVTAYYTT